MLNRNKTGTDEIQNILDRIDADTVQLRNLPTPKEDGIILPVLTGRPGWFDKTILLHKTINNAAYAAITEGQPSQICECQDNELEIWRRDYLFSTKFKYTAENTVHCAETIISMLGDGNVHLVCHNDDVLTYITKLATDLPPCVVAEDNIAPDFDEKQFITDIPFDTTRIDIVVPNTPHETHYHKGTTLRFNCTHVKPNKDIKGRIIVDFPQNPALSHFTIFLYNAITHEDAQSLPRGTITVAEAKMIDLWTSEVTMSFAQGNNNRLLTVEGPTSFTPIFKRLIPA